MYKPISVQDISILKSIDEKKVDNEILYQL